MDSIKYFGLVMATLNRTNMTAKLEYAQRGKQPLSDGHRQRCVDWAKQWCEQQGLSIDMTGVSDGR
jgi:hypothetical protein